MISLSYKGKKTEDELMDFLSHYDKDFPSIKGNFLIHGDNLEAMYRLLSKYEGKIDLIYIDPPFNTSQAFYSSNGRANTISNSADSEIAYDDNLPKDEFLEFIRERLILMRKLLSENGSIYLHIDYKIGHYVKILMDEVFGEENYLNDISRIKSNPKNFDRKAYGNEKDMILFYSKRHYSNIWNELKEGLSEEILKKRFKQIDEDGRRFTTIPLHAPGESKKGETSKPWRGMLPPVGRHWRTSPEELDRLDAENLIQWSSTGNPRIKKYADEHKGDKIQDIWYFKDPQNPVYPTEKNHDLLRRIILQSSNEDSIVMDCFAGGGTTLKVATELRRKWIGIDQSDVSIQTIRDTLFGTYSILELSDLSIKKINRKEKLEQLKETKNDIILEEDRVALMKQNKQTTLDVE